MLLSYGTTLYPSHRLAESQSPRVLGSARQGVQFYEPKMCLVLLTFSRMWEANGKGVEDCRWPVTPVVCTTHPPPETAAPHATLTLASMRQLDFKSRLHTLVALKRQPPLSGSRVAMVRFLCIVSLVLCLALHPCRARSIAGAAPCWEELAAYSVAPSDSRWANVSRINNPAFNGSLC